LFVQNTWPSEGKLKFVTGAGRGKPWGEVRYKSDQDVLAADFAESDGLYSHGFFGCNALAYIYPDSSGGFAGAVLYHVPSGSLKGIRGHHGMHGPCHPPQEYARILAQRGGSPNNVWIVIAIWGTNYEQNVKEQVTHCTEDGAMDDRVKVILVKDQGFTFGVRYDGAVGQCGGPPRRVREEEIRSGKSKSCCYITTAACRSLGLPDDCRELQTLRRFRDEVLLPHGDWRRRVNRYYENAPAVVAAIDQMPDRASIYDWIYHSYVQPAVAAIDQGDLIKASRIFEAGMDEIERICANPGTVL
jgi:hypothetical protein